MRTLLIIAALAVNGNALDSRNQSANGQPITPNSVTSSGDIIGNTGSFGASATRSTITAAGSLDGASGFTISGASVTVSTGLFVTFGSTRAQVGGTVFSSNYSIVTTTTTTAAGGVIGFSTFTFPAGSLNIPGMCVRIKCHYLWSGSGNTKEVYTLVNGVIFGDYSQTTADSGVETDMRLCRVSESLADWFYRVARETATVAFDDQGAVADTVDYAAAVNVSCAALGATANGDASFRNMKVIVEP